MAPGSIPLLVPEQSWEEVSFPFGWWKIVQVSPLSCHSWFSAVTPIHVLGFLLKTDTHAHLPTHPCSFWIPSRHGILCSSWQNSWLSCLCSPSSVSWTSSSDSCQLSFLHLDLLRSGSLRASTLLTSEWLCSQSWLHEPSNAHILFPGKPFFNGALWATYFLGFLFF